TLSQMLSEGRDTWIALVTRESGDAVSQHRARLHVQPDKGTHQRLGGKAFVAAWVPRMEAAGILTEEEARTVLADSGIQLGPEGIVERQIVHPLTTGEVLVTIRRWHKEHDRYPVRADLCAVLAPRAGDWVVYDRIRTLLRLREVDETADARLRPMTNDADISKVTTSYMSPEEVARRYGPPGSRKPVGTAPVEAPCEPPPKENLERVVEANTGRKGRKLPPSAALLAEAEALKAVGIDPITTLIKRYGATKPGIYKKIKQALRAMGQEDEYMFWDRPVKAPKPAAKRGPRFKVWPPDEEFAQRVEAIYAGPAVPVEAALCKEFSCSSPTFWNHLDEVYLRLGRPKPTRRHSEAVKRLARQPAQTERSRSGLFSLDELTAAMAEAMADQDSQNKVIRILLDRRSESVPVNPI
ncbi:MAG: hypothetical protein Q8R28_22635, partial [Dehalococcoidia bacterium]|nr:hypothetical protein [Dehalococcoidia bacterium]